MSVDWASFTPAGDSPHEVRAIKGNRVLVVTQPIALVQAVGWMAHTRDRKMQEIYVDRDFGGWGDMTATRRGNQLTAPRTLGSNSTVAAADRRVHETVLNFVT